MLSLLFAIPIATQAQTQMSNVKHVFIILMENHNWTGDNSGASFGAPDIKGSPLAPYINSLIPLRAHAEQYGRATTAARHLAPQTSVAIPP